MTGGRRSGNTTRRVDLAVQTLFHRKEIIIPYKSQLEDDRFLRGRDMGFEQKLIKDSDWRVNPEVQRELLKRVIRRLDMEHGGQFIVKDNVITLVE